MKQGIAEMVEKGHLKAVRKPNHFAALHSADALDANLTLALHNGT